jgi:hypothetical protein
MDYPTFRPHLNTLIGEDGKSANLPPGEARAHRELAPLRRGADQLADLSEFALRGHPRALARARQDYADLCRRLYRRIARAQRRRP